LATTDCIHYSGDLRSCGRVVKLVDVATPGGRFDETFIVVGPKTDFTIVIVRFLTTRARPLSENVKNRGAVVAVPSRPGLAGPASPYLGIRAREQQRRRFGFPGRMMHRRAELAL